jgi:hypothetical protein
LAREDLSTGIPVQRNKFRANDPAPTTISKLSSGDYGRRVVIRTGEFLGTVCGVLLEAHPHSSLRQFICVQLREKKELTLRGDMEVIVLD